MDTPTRSKAVGDIHTVAEAAPPSSGVGSAGPPPEIERGATVGRYTVLDRLAAGTTATVFSAYDAERRRMVAIKMLRAEVDSTEARTRWIREAQALVGLKHPHVVRVYEVGMFGDRVFIAMEFVEGASLRSWLEDRRPWSEVFDVLKSAGRGLAAVHEATLVHGKLNLDNVLVGKDGRVWVTDFGLARHEQAARVSAESPPRSSELATHPGVTVRPVQTDKTDGDEEDATVARKVDLDALAKEAAAEERKAKDERDASDDATVARRVDLSTLKKEAEIAAKEQAESAAHEGASGATKQDGQGTAKQESKVASNSEEDEATVVLKVDALKGPSSKPTPKGPPAAPAAAAKPKAAPLRPAEIHGTPGFTAPEHLATGESDARGDQFSFAVTMYVALYGAPPFAFKDLSTYRDAVVRAPAPPPSSPVPPWVHRVIERGLSRDRSARFATMAGMIDALERDPSRTYRSWAMGMAAVACALGLMVYGQLRTEPTSRRAVSEGKAAEANVARASIPVMVRSSREAERLLLESNNVDLHHPRAALEAAELAFQAAERGGDDTLAARSAARVAYLLGSLLSQPDEAERWLKAAEAITDRAGHDEALDATIGASRIAVNAARAGGEPKIEKSAPVEMSRRERELARTPGVKTTPVVHSIASPAPPGVSAAALPVEDPLVPAQPAIENANPLASTPVESAPQP